MDPASSAPTLVGLRRLDYLERLPTELVASLLQLAGPQACVRAACSSRRLWQIGVAHPVLWRNLYKHSFPLDDKEIEWIEWCSSILSLEEGKEPHMAEESSRSMPARVPVAHAAPGAVSPIYARANNPVSSPPPVLRGVLVRWFRLFGRRVYTNRNWRQMTFQPNTLHFPVTFSKAAWHELHIWKSCLSNTIFFLDAHVHAGHPTDYRRPTEPMRREAEGNGEPHLHADKEYDEHSLLEDDDNDYLDESYDSCHSSENEQDVLVSTSAASAAPAVGTNHDNAPRVPGQLFILLHQPGAAVRSLRLGASYSRLSLRRAPVARSNSQYIVVDGDAIVKRTAHSLSANKSASQHNGDEPSRTYAALKPSNHRPTIQRCIWVWRVEDTEPILTLCGHTSGRRPSTIATATATATVQHTELRFTDLMGNWLLCRRNQESTCGLTSDYVIYDLSRCTKSPASTAGEDMLACLATNASTAHFQRVSDEVAAIDKYGQVNRVRACNAGNANISVHVYSHSYCDDSVPAHSLAAAGNDEAVKKQPRSLAWRVDAVCCSGTETLRKNVASGVCRNAIARDIADSGPLIASRIDDERVLLQVQSFIMDTVWLAVLSIGDNSSGGGILWQQRGSFFRPELYTGYGFIAVNSTLGDDAADAADMSNTSASASSMMADAPVLASPYDKSTAPYRSSELSDAYVYYCDNTACKQLVSSNRHACSNIPAQQQRQDSDQQDACPQRPTTTAFSKTIVLSTNNNDFVAGGKKHTAENGELSDMSQEQRQSVVRLLCLAHGRSDGLAMQFTGLCRTIRIIGAIGLTTPASSAEWYFCVTDIAEGRQLSRLDFIQRGRNIKGQICSTYSVMVDEERPGYCWVFDFSEPGRHQKTSSTVLCH